jgi:uncharacterized protein (DUF1778 family)
MATPARARADRIEFRTAPATRQLIDRAVEVSGSTLTQFAETSLILAAQQVLADRDRFMLAGDALEEWEAINSRPARDLPGLRSLFDRPSPFTS